MAKGEEKRTRKALRLAADGRKPLRRRDRPPPGQYLTAHACFVCRKSFKMAPRTEGNVAACPNCGNRLYEMGRSFKAQKRRDEDQWRKVQALYASGFRFFSYRRFPGCAPLPETYAEVKDFVKSNPNHPFRVAPSKEALNPMPVKRVRGPRAHSGGGTR